MLLPGGGHKRMLGAAACDFGVMATPAGGKRLRLLSGVRVWAADNGCFSAGEAFDLDAYLLWLAALRSVQATCLYATAPDVVGDWAATWERSRPVLPLIRALGYPVAVVAQDGVTAQTFPWSECDALFVGGTTRFKESEVAAELVSEANARGLHSHVGRVNTRRRILMAGRMGAKSIDGTCLRAVPDFWFGTLRRWLGEANHQMMLPLEV